MNDFTKLEQDLFERLTACWPSDRDLDTDGKAREVARRVAARLTGEEIRRRFEFAKFPNEPEQAIRDVQSRMVAVYLMQDEIHIDSAFEPTIVPCASGVGYTLQLTRKINS